MYLQKSYSEASMYVGVFHKDRSSSEMLGFKCTDYFFHAGRLVILHGELDVWATRGLSFPLRSHQAQFVRLSRN